MVSPHYFHYTDQPYSCSGTNAQIRDPAERLSFVGGVAADDGNGVACMDLRRIESNSTLVARKAWFFMDQGVVALGAGIASDGRFNIITTLEQRRLDLVTGVWYGTTNDSLPQRVPDDSLLQIPQQAWVWHAGSTYGLLAPPSGDSVTLMDPATYLAISTRVQTGRWSEITQGPDTDTPLAIPTFLRYYALFSRDYSGISFPTPSGDSVNLLACCYWSEVYLLCSSRTHYIFIFPW